MKKEKVLKPIELGKFSEHKLKKNRTNEVLTGTNWFGAPADNYTSGDWGKRKKKDD